MRNIAKNTRKLIVLDEGFNFVRRYGLFIFLVILISVLKIVGVVNRWGG